MAGNPIGNYALPTVITDAATQSVDTSQGGYFTWTLGASRTVSTWLNPVAGQVIVLEVTQDATGSRTLTWPSNVSWGTNGTAPTLTATALKTDAFRFTWNPTAAKWRGETMGLNYA